MRVKVSRHNSHFVYGVIQSGLTCAVAAAIASYPFLAEGTFAVHWARSWMVSWIVMLPVVILFAPVIRRLVDRVTTDEP